jgi:5-methylthioadenosine/S-adenosylhomocysteine deaminase
VQARRAKPQGEAKKLYQQMEKIVGTFCPGLAKAPLHIHRYGASHHAHSLHDYFPVFPVVR